jgi:hypothetical protein
MSQCEHTEWRILCDWNDLPSALMVAECFIFFVRI